MPKDPTILPRAVAHDADLDHLLAGAGENAVLGVLHGDGVGEAQLRTCLLYTSPSPRDS